MTINAIKPHTSLYEALSINLFIHNEFAIKSIKINVNQRKSMKSIRGCIIDQNLEFSMFQKHSVCCSKFVFWYSLTSNHQRIHHHKHHHQNHYIHYYWQPRHHHHIHLAVAAATTIITITTTMTITLPLPQTPTPLPLPPDYHNSSHSLSLCLCGFLSTCLSVNLLPFLCDKQQQQQL